MAGIREGFDARNATDKELANHYFEMQEADLEVCKLEERWLLPTAERWGVDIPHELWITASHIGERYLDYSARARIRNLIREERHKSWRFRIEIIAAITGIVGAATGFLAVYLSLR